MASPPDAQAQIDLTPGFSIPNPFDSVCRARATSSARSSSSSSRRSSGSRRRSRAARCEWLLATPGLHRQRRLRRAQPAALVHDGRRRGRCSRWCSRSPACATTRPGSRRAGSYEAVEALARGGLAAGALAVYPEVFGSLSIATNYLTYGITHAPGVEAGLTKLLGGGDGRRASRRWGSGRSRRSSRSCCWCCC